jgi:transcriptional regulator with XRE-family HTH domain
MLEYIKGITRQRWHFMLNKFSVVEYQKLIGERIKQYRVNAGVSQKDLENESGVSIRSISRLEQGASIQLESLIKILSALNLEGNIDLLIPDQTKRPSFYLNDSNKPKQRVRKKEESAGSFKWGDEE